jgi:hypothetical protein
MKKAKTEQPAAEENDMRSEYDFTGKQGVRGKCYRAYRQGHTVKINRTDGSVGVQYFTLEEDVPCSRQQP